MLLLCTKWSNFLTFTLPSFQFPFRKLIRLLTSGSTYFIAYLDTFHAYISGKERSSDSRVASKALQVRPPLARSSLFPTIPSTNHFLQGLGTTSQNRCFLCFAVCLCSVILSVSNASSSSLLCEILLCSRSSSNTFIILSTVFQVWNVSFANFCLFSLQYYWFLQLSLFVFILESLTTYP